MSPRNLPPDPNDERNTDGAGSSAPASLNAPQLLNILARISDGVVALDSDWRYTYVNDAAATMLQRNNPAELIGKHIWTEYPEGVGQPFHKAYVKAIEDQQPIVFEEYFPPWDKWFENRIFPSRDGLTILFSDTTKQKKESIALRLAAAVFSNTKDSVVITDTQSRVTNVNPGFVIATGFARDDIVGRHVSFLCENLPENPDWTEIDAADSWSGQILAKHKGGSRIPQVVSKETLFDISGIKEGCIFIGSDLSEMHNRIAIEQQLSQAQKMEAIGNLTGGVAHDFNNLLSVIMGNLELLRDEILPGQENLGDTARLIQAGLDATMRGADLTRNMLSFARRARLDPKDLDLNSIVGKTRTWIGRTLPSNISFETSLLAGLWTVHADESSTQSALLNLIVNARDAMPDGGKLTVETSNVRVDDDYIQSRHEDIEPGRYVMLAVSDTGHGILSGDLAQIFEPFFSTKAPGSGSGLGLSMIQGFMKQSGGSVRVYSEPGQGTTFKLYFKAEFGRDSDTARAVTATIKNTGGSRILVAEDEPEVLGVVAQMLTNAGYRVSAAMSGDEAMVIFANDSHFDLLLTDIVMPGKLQGTTLAKELRRMKPELPVVFMSGYASEATVHGNGLRPEDIRLMKPGRRADLIAAIERALATPTNKKK